ncbi:MAG: hypothetical protein DMG37_03340 [Acidobacteria bacterium]|nr:MAG: hypothetical protein DMG37_03340 [Acidobacteriota bacterium]
MWRIAGCGKIQIFAQFTADAITAGTLDGVGRKIATTRAILEEGILGTDSENLTRPNAFEASEARRQVRQKVFKAD